MFLFIPKDLLHPLFNLEFICQQLEFLIFNEFKILKDKFELIYSKSSKNC